MPNKNFYITTTLPYVNASPHIGFALEMVQADVLARLHKLLGDDIFFNTGTDEHGQKIFDAAKKENKTPQEFTDYYAEKFRFLKDLLNLYSDIHFIRTTDESHIKAAQEFWKRCEERGDIYKKNYQVKYCIGCELEKTDSELVNGRCELHPNLELEIREEENYFFRYSKYQNALLDLYEKNPALVFPDFRFNEIRQFVKGGLNDFSISRPRSKMSWGIDVPGDSDHVMYVWFDALINYISTLGWPACYRLQAKPMAGRPVPVEYVKEGEQQQEEDLFEKFWTNGSALQVAGKDQIRMQAGMWQAMLLSAKLPPTKQIFIHGFINSGGQKMSKSLGNVIDPVGIVEEYGADALRYYLLREIHPYEDSDFTMEKFKESYNANLANGIGNLTSRIMKMAETNLVLPVTILKENLSEEYVKFFDVFAFNKAMDHIWGKIAELDGIIQEKQPFKLVKTEKEEGIKIIKDLVEKLYIIAAMLNPVMPETSEKIKSLIKENKSPTEPLFLRRD